jgi:hypothetical protein
MSICARTHTPSSFDPGNVPRFSLSRRMGGLQSQCGHFGNTEKFIFLSRDYVGITLIMKSNNETSVQNMSLCITFGKIMILYELLQLGM